MGYRVGGQCFATSEEASNYKMSMVVPTITSDGSLKAPIYSNGHWYYGSHKIHFTHPECDPVEFFNDGVIVGIYILILFAITFLFKNAMSIFEILKSRYLDD